MREIKHIGFIGIGNMGAPMAAQLVKAGFELTVFDANPAASEAFSRTHACQVASSAAQVGQHADAVIFMLPDDRIVRKILFEDGLADCLPIGSVAIDMGTSSPASTQRTGAELAECDVGYLDAPVMGGVIFARDATLDIMVGGDEAWIERCEPVFSAMSRRIWPCGQLGNAHALKAMTNYINACALANTLEAMVIGRKFGLDADMMAQAIDAMCNGRQHPIVKKIIPHVLTHQFGTGMATGLIAKDVKIAVEAAHSVNAAAPLCELTASLWREASEQIGPNTDHSQIVRYWETRSDITL